MAWWHTKCPVREVERAWIDESMDWFVIEFGRERLLGPVILPVDSDFPGAYRDGRVDIPVVFRLLCDHMGVDAESVELEVEYDASDDDRDALSGEVALSTRSDGAAGHHRVRAGRSVVSVRDDQAEAPTALVATVAHELGHALLLGQGRISADRQDHEPLTDLLTVYFGLGIFTANAAFDFAHRQHGRFTYTSTRRLGYLTEPMYGYALARYAWLRGEAAPDWSTYVDINPRAFLKRGLAFLSASAEHQPLPD